MTPPEITPEPQVTDADIVDTMELADDKRIIVYNLNRALDMPIVRAPQERVWMNETRVRFAYRCLPLLLANQHGWLILNSHKIKSVWRGTDEQESTKITFAKGSQPPYSAQSHFGHGILTFSLPYLFRTPPGYNLIVRGPTNSPKDGIQPLDGVVETDWASATFTMNWIFTRSDYPVVFEKGEPIAMIYPVRRSEIEAFHGEIHDVDDHPEQKQKYNEWSEERRKWNEDLHVPGSEAAQKGWQKDYFQGMNDGVKVQDHQTRLNLHEFVKVKRK